MTAFIVSISLMLVYSLDSPVNYYRLNYENAYSKLFGLVSCLILIIQRIFVSKINFYLYLQMCKLLLEIFEELNAQSTVINNSLQMQTLFSKYTCLYSIEFSIYSF